MMNARRLIFEEYQRQKAIPFAWGGADCLSFAADVAQLLTGNDPADALRDLYDSETAAKRIMVARGWHTLGDVAASMYPEIPVAMAQNGDWAFIVNDDGSETLGVVCGAQLLARTKDGLGIHVLTKASRAFRVLE
jgi:hypothetical protein